MLEKCHAVLMHICGPPPLCFHYCNKVIRCCWSFIHLLYDSHLWNAAYPHAFTQTNERFGPGSSSTNNKIPLKCLKNRVWPLHIFRQASYAEIQILSSVKGTSNWCHWSMCQDLKIMIYCQGQLAKTAGANFYFSCWLSMWFCHKNYA